MHIKLTHLHQEEQVRILALRRGPVALLDMMTVEIDALFKSLSTTILSNTTTLSPFWLAVLRVLAVSARYGIASG